MMWIERDFDNGGTTKQVFSCLENNQKKGLFRWQQQSSKELTLCIKNSFHSLIIQAKLKMKPEALAY